MTEKLKQHLKEKAASFILSGDDIKKSLEILENSPGPKVPKEVLVWQPFENDNLSTLISNIENLHEIFIESHLKK
jgi:hypothetical protein